MTPILVVFLFLLVAKLGTSIFLDVLNVRYARSKSNEVPDAFRDFIELPEYQKAIEYTSAKTRFGILNNLFDALVLVVVLCAGVLAWIYGGLTDLFGSGVWGQSLVLFLSGVFLGLPGLPFDWWHTFKLEQRFGFNNSTLKLWISDKLKGFILGFIIGFPLLALLIYLVEAAGPLWWVWGFALIFVFQLVMVVVYPMFIMPLFNKLEPMEEGELKNRLFALADRTGFQAQTILVMDGSKRSGHSNAFFSGFGRFRRIVLFDTLIEQMEAEELEAVLAHEIGHYKMGHIPKMIGLAGVSAFIMFAVLGWLAGAAWFVQGFGFGPETGGAIVPVFLLFSMLSGLVTFWMSPLTSRLSRKHEYEADAFARDAMGGVAPLSRALRKLHKENLSNLTPHPLYSSFHYSHPTLLEREAGMNA